MDAQTIRWHEAMTVPQGVPGTHAGAAKARPTPKRCRWETGQTGRDAARHDRWESTEGGRRPALGAHQKDLRRPPMNEMSKGE